jgi:hypothetical protein
LLLRAPHPCPHRVDRRVAPWSAVAQLPPLQQEPWPLPATGMPLFRRHALFRQQACSQQVKAPAPLLHSKAGSARAALHKEGPDGLTGHRDERLGIDPDRQCHD